MTSQEYFFYFQQDLAIMAEFKACQTASLSFDPATSSALYWKFLRSALPYFWSDYFWMNFYNKQIISQIYFYNVIEPYGLKYFDPLYPIVNYRPASYLPHDAMYLKHLYSPNTGWEYCEKLMCDFVIQHVGTGAWATYWYFPELNSYALPDNINEVELFDNYFKNKMHER